MYMMKERLSRTQIASFLDVYLALAFDKETVFFCHHFQQHLFIFI
jgi:hypothetical protein